MRLEVEEVMNKSRVTGWRAFSLYRFVYYIISCPVPVCVYVFKRERARASCACARFVVFHSFPF